MAAKRKGLMPAFLNLSKLVSAPNAAMDMVRRKVSSWLIQSTMLSGSKSRELNPITTRKRMANHGMLAVHQDRNRLCRIAGSGEAGA